VSRPPTPGLRESILRAAEPIFSRRDYHEVAMDEVAGASGVGKGTLYRYFPGKRQLYVAVVLAGIGRLRQDLEAAVAAEPTPGGRIGQIVRGLLAYFWDRRRFFALVHWGEQPPDAHARAWRRHRVALSRLVQQVLEEATAAGQIRGGDARLAAEMLLGMVRGANRHRTKDDTLDALAAAVVDVFLRGVGTPAGRRALAAGRRPPPLTGGGGAH